MMPKQERALIAVDWRGIATVLTTDGVNVAFMVNEVSCGVEDIGLADASDFPAPGLYLWTGHAAMENNAAWDEPPCPETVFHGELRIVQLDEVAALFGMTPPDDEFDAEAK